MSKIREHFFFKSGDCGDSSSALLPRYNERNLHALGEAFSAAVFHAPLQRDLELLELNGAADIHRQKMTDVMG